VVRLLDALETTLDFVEKACWEGREAAVGFALTLAPWPRPLALPGGGHDSSPPPGSAQASFTTGRGPPL